MSYHAYYAMAYQYRFYLAAAFIGLVVLSLIGYAVYRYGRPGVTLRRPSLSLSRPRLPRVGVRSWLAGLADRLPNRPTKFESQDSGDVSEDSDEADDGFAPNWRAIGTAVFVAVVVLAPLGIFYLQGAWPFGPWRGATIIGLPAYWTVFFGMLLLSLSILPVYIYFLAPIIPLAGNAMPRLMWIIASWAQGATIFDRSADGRYYARPMRQNTDDEDDHDAEMWVDGDWQPVPGNIEFVSRLAWRPVAFTWEKSDWAVKEIEATEYGEDPVDYLVERGMMDHETAVQFQPGGASSAQPSQAAADGGVAYDDYGAPIDPDAGQPRANGGVSEPRVPYNILDYRGHAFQAFNPWPDGGDDDEYVIDTRKVSFKLAGSGETGLIQRAKDIALTDTAHTGRMGQLVGWVMIGGSLIFGVGVAYFTV